jgi:dipeptidyl-peptidase-4
VPNPGAPTWLDDGSFLWISDRTGHSHVYLYHAAGSLKGPVTAGEWDVRKVHGVEAAGSWMYFSATERSPISVHTYRIRTDGRDMERLTSAEGTHESTFSPGMGYFIDTWSASGRPAEVRLHSSDGSEIRVLEESTAPAVPDFELGSTEYFQVDARDGFRLEAMMIKPPDFDPNRRYPVLCHVYGGPMTPLVRNAWGGPTFLWHHLIASRGAIVWVVDNRTASAKGVGSAWPAYRCFGTTELRDLEDAVGWLRGQRYIDPDRFGIWGWSFGGYLTAYAMTHSRLFRMGIAGAPVTDWTLYDTVYTERYMQTPERNPEGYRSSSVLEAASRLHGKLLILHGTLDDNVHVEHSMRLVRELQRSGKDFHLMLYPGAGHVIEDADQLYDVRKRMTSFVLENL